MLNAHINSGSTSLCHVSSKAKLRSVFYLLWRLASIQALWVCFRWKPLLLASFCQILEHSATIYSKDTKNYLWNMWKGIRSSFKPAQAYDHHRGGETINWLQCVWIVARVWSKWICWKGTRSCTMQQVLEIQHIWNIILFSQRQPTQFFNCVFMLFTVKFISKHWTHMLFSCGVTLWASLCCGKACGASKLW